MAIINSGIQQKFTDNTMQYSLPAQRLEKFSGLIPEIYASSAEHGRWPATVGVLTQSIEAIQAILFTP